MLNAAALVLFALMAGAAAPQPPPSPVNEVEGVTVTAVRPAPTLAKPAPAEPEPFSFFREFCYDSMRLNRRSARPIGDPRWRPLDPAERTALRISDQSTVAYGRVDPQRGLALVLRVEHGPMPSAVRDGLIQHRCTLTVSGPANPDQLRRDMSAVFNGGPTQDHSDNRNAPAYPSIPGWRQYLWSATPKRGSSRWEVFRSGGLIFVTNGRFYTGCDYVSGELRHTKDAPVPVSVLLLTHTFAHAVAPEDVTNAAPCR
jgi:hypothetical protein